MREQTCCFTGHRVIPDGKDIVIKRRIEEEVMGLIDRGFCYFGAGGALGFDTLAALAVLRLKQRFSHIKLILILPCKSQADNWSTPDIQRYENVKSCADKVVYTSEEYYPGCMNRRNRHLVDSSAFCICYLNKETGGTRYTVDYCLRKGVEVLNLYEE